MLDTELIGTYGQLKTPTLCAITGMLLGANFVTLSIGNGHYVRYRASAQSQLTDERVNQLKELVAPKKPSKANETKGTL